MHKLSGETVRLISSAQVITSIASVVKELIENSLDANADNIEIKLENFGVDKVEVRDNGDGIRAEDADFMGRRHYTSKLTSHDDLENLFTYGFRGEALGSLCAVSNVAIATKTKDEEFGRCYILDHEGIASSPKPSQCCTGTTVTASRLFHNIPVRKQYYSNAKRRREEVKKVEDLLLSFGVVCPGVRFSLSHNKASIWQKNKLPNLKTALLNVLGSNVMGHLTRVEKNDEETQVKIEGYLPKPGSDGQLTSRSTDDRTWISVNGRPVTMKDISKVVKQYYSQAHPKAGNVRHVVMCLAFTMPTYLVDVNLEPNKTKVLLQNNDAVLCLIIQMLEELYSTTPTEEPTNLELSQKPPLPNPSSEPATLSQSQNQPLKGSLSHTASTTACELELKKHVEEFNQSNLTLHDISTCLNPTPSAPLGDSEAIDLICDILENPEPSQNDTSQKPVNSERVKDISTIQAGYNISLLERDGENRLASQNQGNCNTIKDNTMKLPHQNISVLTQDGGTLSAPCFQSTPAVHPESSGIQISFVDVPDRSVTTADINRTQGDAAGGEAQIKDNICNINKESIDGGADAAAKEVEELWSKGHGLTEPDGKVVQPSVLLIPGKQQPSTNAMSQEVTTPMDSSFQASLPCPIRPLQESTDISMTSTRVLQSSGNSNLFTTTVTTSGNQSGASPAEAGQRTPNQSPGKLNELTSPGSSAVASAACDSPVRVAMKKPVEEKTSPATQYDLVGRAPVKRPQDAFAFFFKEKKPEILRQHPAMDFMSINKILKRQWEELDEAERIRYEEIEARDLQRYKDQVVYAKQSVPTKDPKNGLPAKKKKKVEKLSNQSLVDEMLASQRERKQQEALEQEEGKRFEIQIPFSVSKLRELPVHVQKRSNMDEWRLIGSLADHGVWTAITGKQLSVFNQYRAQEVVLYHRLLATHKLPYHKLPVPIELTAGMFGDQKNWYTLLGMKSQVNPVDQSRIFTDERLILNGFEIRQLIDPDTMDARLEVVSMSMNIVPFYGLDDLTEIVETIATQRVQSVMQCRPLKLANHLMGEAVRMARSLPTVMTEEEVSSIKESVEGLTMWKSKLCLHGKSFVKDIYTIPEVDPD
ncbi:PMS1 protein homolog 1-like isoform X1 [Lytechinus pictus]|uniref:PMS1 protein homolog 1-like isoform X1 n=1 Tax=Lytechinus pictus TaxID=7653 RepID=UPI0030B9CF30